MKTEEQSLRAFEEMKRICKTLSSPILLIQTPGSFNPSGLADAERFFQTVEPE